MEKTCVVLPSNANHGKLILLIPISSFVDPHGNAVFAAPLLVTARSVSTNPMQNVSTDFGSISITNVATKFKVQILVNSNYLTMKENMDIISMYISLLKYFK